MRGTMLLMGLFCAALSGAQTEAPTPNLFQTVRPDVIVTVRKHSTGADLVKVMAVNPGYSVTLLKEQLAKLAESLGGKARGVMGTKYSASDPKYATAVATCAMDGLIDRQAGNLHLAEIARAFAGVPEPNTVKGLNVSFDGEKPAPTMVQWYAPKDGAVRVQAQFTPQPPIIEYRVELLSQDPAKIDIPASVERKNENTTSTARRTGVDWTLWGLLAGAAVAAGALVYSLLLKSSSKPRSE